jgi:aspartate/methionine/tyrosine aminotransferase
LNHYSQRLPWNFFSNTLTDQANRKRNRDEAICDLTNSNPTELLTDYPHAQIAEAFSQIASFRYQPDPLGSEQARAAVCAYYAARDIDVTPGQLLLTASTSEAYALLFKLFCDPGDEILVPRPSYPLFEFLAHLEAIRVVNYRLQFDGNWYIDFNHLQAQLSSQTRAIVVVNPNNPTGSLLKPSEVETLVKIASERGIPIICDEVFLDYAFEPSTHQVRTLIGRDDLLSFSLNGLSKAAGMPQMKLGWIAISGPASDREEARERLELIADTYLSVGTPVQKALPRLLLTGEKIQRAIAARIQTNRQTLRRILRDGPAQVLHSEGGWSAIVRLPATRSEESWALRLLNECGILVQPGYFFDMEGEPYIVVSLMGRTEEFERAISEIHDLANK